MGATYAKGCLIMVGASRTSLVRGHGMRRRHERRHTLPRFRALLGDNTPSPTLRGLRMITKAKVSTKVLLELFGRQGGARLALSSLCYVVYLYLGPNPLHGCPGGLYRPTPWGYNSNPAGRGSQPSVSQTAILPASFWGPPTGGSHRQA